MIKIIPMMVVLLAAGFSCRWSYPDAAPAATVDGDVITRGYLVYRFRDHSGEEKKSKASRDLLDATISNIIVSREAQRLSVDSYGNYYRKKMDMQTGIRFEFVCDHLGFGDRCDERFHRYMAEEMGLVEGGIDWNDIFPVNRGLLVPDDGQDRSYGSSAVITWNQKAAQKIKFTFKYWSVLNKPQSYNVHHLSLDNIISRLDAKSRMVMRKSSNEARNRFVRMVLHQYAAESFVVYSLDEKHRALYREIEKRAEQELLAEHYRNEFLTGTIGPGGRIAGRVGSRKVMSDDEYRTQVEALRKKAMIIMHEENL